MKSFRGLEKSGSSERAPTLCAPRGEAVHVSQLIKEHEPQHPHDSPVKQRDGQPIQSGGRRMSCKRRGLRKRSPTWHEPPHSVTGELSSPLRI